METPRKFIIAKLSIRKLVSLSLEDSRCFAAGVALPIVGVESDLPCNLCGLVKDKPRNLDGIPKLCHSF